LPPPAAPCPLFFSTPQGSGLSDGAWVTLGAREVDDLDTVVQYLREEGSTSTIGLWGRSMGAVTALLYAARDPGVAAVVADSPFSRLVDLMLELGSDAQAGGAVSLPKPLLRVALAVLRRSVRRRAGFSLDAVAPLDAAPATFAPALFGHARGDTFVAPHHSARLFAAYAGDAKRLVAFEGDHNSGRPDFWYHSATIFLLGALQVEELVGPEVDLTAEEDAPHMCVPPAPGILCLLHGAWGTGAAALWAGCLCPQRRLIVCALVVAGWGAASMWPTAALRRGRARTRAKQRGGTRCAHRGTRRRCSRAPGWWSLTPRRSLQRRLL
jgi:pimeloyl-ACP methyl ester carboxylesterase